MKFQELKGNRAGRPSKLTAVVARLIVRKLMQGNSLKTVASLARVAPPTLYNWLKTGETHEQTCTLELNDCRLANHDEFAFRELYLSHCKAEQYSADIAVKNIRDIGKKEWTANAWLLERRHKEEWAKETEILHKVTGEVKHSHSLEGITSQQKLRMAAALAQRAKLESESQNVIDVEPINELTDGNS